MKHELIRYICDHPSCKIEKVVRSDEQLEPYEWLIVDARVVGQGSGVTHFCPEHKPEILKGMLR